MLISTQISTRIILDQKDMEKAIIAFIMAEMDVPENPTIAVDYEDDADGNLQAVVSITAANDSKVEKPAAKTRGKKTAAKAAEPEEKNEPVAAEQPDETTSEETAANEPEPESDTKVPFDVDEEPAKAAETAPVQSMKIFDNATSSAAPSTPAPAPDPTVQAKSLFANLKPPANQ